MRVLIATDLSLGADIAIREGAALAAGPGDALAIVHALPQPSVLETWAHHAKGEAAHRVTAAHESVRERTRGIVGNQAEVFVEDDVDYAAIVLRAQIWTADVVVVGSYGGSGLSRGFGSVTERVLRHAPCSVLVARESAAHGWVLAASDLSATSLGTIAAAAVEAKRRRARLEVVHALGFLEAEARYVLELATPAITSPPGVFEVVAEELGNSVSLLHVEATCKVLDRPAAAAVGAEAEALGAELIVVGAHSKSGLRLRALGRVAEKIVRTAACSVLAVRPPVVVSSGIAPTA
jgi:nucleotide-binding universal stress UspA family protein